MRVAGELVNIAIGGTDVSATSLVSADGRVVAEERLATFRIYAIRDAGGAMLGFVGLPLELDAQRVLAAATAVVRAVT